MSNDIRFKISEMKIENTFYDDINTVFGNYGYQEAYLIHKNTDLKSSLYKSELESEDIIWLPRKLRCLRVITLSPKCI